MVVCHYIPFKNTTIDLILCQAVLEHVIHPQKVVKNIGCTLKLGGVVYAEIPFLQGYHGDPRDYTRFTLRGIEHLFSQFDKIDSGVCVGPFSTICWWLRKVPTIFFSKISFIFVVEFIFCWLTFWLKYFDYIFIRAKNAHMLSAGLFYIGNKRKRNQ